MSHRQRVRAWRELKHERSCQFSNVSLHRKIASSYISYSGYTNNLFFAKFWRISCTLTRRMGSTTILGIVTKRAGIESPELH